MQNEFVVEVCAFSIEAAIQAQKAGANRIELCSSLSEGGTTPSVGAIKIAREQLDIDLFIMIRPRGGNFIYTQLEIEEMKVDIMMAKELEADGVVFGVLNEEGAVDMENMLALMELAEPMDVTFHRAFDYTKDPFLALENIRNLHIKRVLTSGQQNSWSAGKSLVAKLVQQGAGQISIMAGGGITPSNVAEIVKTTQVKEIHFSALQSPASSMMEDIHIGRKEKNLHLDYNSTDVDKIKSIKKILREMNHTKIH